MTRILSLLIVLCFSSGLHAKDFRLDDRYSLFGGGSVSLKEVIGQKPVYLKFWASWCLDCRREFPSLEQAYRTYGAGGQIAMFAVNLNINETEETISRLLQQHKMTIPVVMDNNGSITSNFAFKGTPYHVLINAKGEVVYTTYKDDAQLQEKLAALSGNGVALPQAGGSSAKAKQSVEAKAAVSLIYFSATWCDWYMKEIHPDMAKNCINSLKVVEALHRDQPGKVLQAFVTHLWTEDKDVTEYVRKFSIAYPVNIDRNNEQFRHFEATGYPTLLVLKDGQEVGRFTDFDQPEKIITDVKKMLK